MASTSVPSSALFPGVLSALSAATAGAAPSAAPPDQFHLRSARSHAEFKDLVARAVAAIRAAEFDKVVLIREVIVEANRALSTRDVVERLRALYPSCAVFHVEGFIGASPESAAVATLRPTRGWRRRFSARRRSEPNTR